MTLGLNTASEAYAVIKLVANYGDNCDLSGPRVGRLVKKLAQAQIDAGYLSGTLKCLNLTPLGRELLERKD